VDFVVSYDMRAPAFGAPARELYAAALDQCAWADDLGFGCVIKLAEDLAVVQLLSAGRLIVAVGAGYRPVEFAMFGRRREERKALYVEAIRVLRAAWSGLPFEYRGRTLRVTPVPDPPPPILLGGSHPAVARRAAHIADGYLPPEGESWDVYRRECLELGKPDPGETCKRLGPIFTFVSRDPESDWERVTPHVVHCVNAYAEWTREAYGRAAGPFAAGVRAEDVRASGAYRVLTPEQTVELAHDLGPDRTFILTPLLGGLDCVPGRFGIAGSRTTRSCSRTSSPLRRGRDSCACAWRRVGSGCPTSSCAAGPTR
jgi:alkanesulfonate monooxygenase SsuD/methylene tetrahydromethanopterin reductase-like flavin-dependent oxidoreductase (luciferase family)